MKWQDSGTKETRKDAVDIGQKVDEKQTRRRNKPSTKDD
jgi:hypothetical protein